MQAKDVLGTSPESTGAASLNQSILSIESSIDSYATIDAYQSAIDELKKSIKQFEFYTIGVVTHVINNPSFENDLSGWTYDGGFKTHTNDGIAPFKEGTVYAETWVASGNNLADSEISQTITDLPNGFYVLTAAAQGINQKESVEVDGVYLFANNSKTSISSLNTYSVNALVEDGTLKNRIKNRIYKCKLGCNI